MCARYEPPLRFMFVGLDGVGELLELPDSTGDLFPEQPGHFVRRPPERNAGDAAVPAAELVGGRWGLISALTPTHKLAGAEKLSTFNSRSERSQVVHVRERLVQSTALRHPGASLL